MFRPGKHIESYIYYPVSVSVHMVNHIEHSLMYVASKVSLYSIALYI